VSVLEAFVLSLALMFPGWAALAFVLVALVIVAMPPKRNRRVRR
jgi:hypothetical protein